MVSTHRRGGVGHSVVDARGWATRDRSKAPCCVELLVCLFVLALQDGLEPRAVLSEKYVALRVQRPESAEVLAW